LIVGVLRISLLLHAPQNLKEKRGLVQKILARCRNRYPLSGAEVGFQDLWQKAELGFSMVSNEEKLIDSVFRRMIDDVMASGLAEVYQDEIEFIHF